MKEIYEQIKQEGIDINKVIQKKATKLKNKLVADITSHKKQEVTIVESGLILSGHFFEKISK